MLHVFFFEIGTSIRNDFAVVKGSIFCIMVKMHLPAVGK